LTIPYTWPVVPQVWEFLFLMLIMKLPIAYLCWVVYWAVKAEPRPPEPAVLRVATEPDPRAPWRLPPRQHSRRRGPHGAPSRGYARTARVRAL
jgi:hypothetical protein